MGYSKSNSVVKFTTSISREIYQTNNLTSCLRELQKDNKLNPKLQRRKEMTIRAEINEIETRNKKDQ